MKEIIMGIDVDHDDGYIFKSTFDLDPLSSPGIL